MSRCTRGGALLLAALALTSATAAAQQTPPAAAPTAVAGPQVGDLAPDFELPGAARYGLLRGPLRLSDFRGQTVIVAFFPKARTKGWTVQMEAYRDQYATLFNNGRRVAVLAVSADPDTTLAAWARDAAFPFAFGSDTAGVAGARYGAWMPQQRYNNRHLFVVGPDGRIAYVARPFRVMAPDAYTELAAVIDRLSPPPEDEDSE